MDLKFDPTINLSTILEAIVLITAAVKLWGRIEARLIAIETKMDPIWRWWNDNHG